MPDLRPYQHDAVRESIKAFETYRSVLIVLPTASGKTIILAKIAEYFRSQGHILVLAQREELLKQAQEKIHAWTSLTTGIEQADSRVAGLFIPDVVIASVQSLSRPQRLERFDPHLFSLIITDEAHHAISTTHRTIYSHFDARHLGCTATPDRLDKKALGAIFAHCAFVYEVRDAIEGRYICPITQRAVYVESLDLSRVRTTAGDLNEGDLEVELMRDENLHKIAAPTVELSEDRPTLVFTTTVDHAKAMVAVLNNYKQGTAESIDGSLPTKEREERLRRFTNGEIQYLCNCVLLTEGVDIPQVSCVAMARPTKSRALYSQVLGRGFRLHPGKDNLLALDFVGNSGKHQLITALDVLDGNKDTEVKARAQAILNEKRGDLGILEALEEAEQQLVEEQRRSAIARARYQAVNVDPFTVLGVRPRAGRWGGAEITEKQIAILEKAKIPSQGLDRGQASEIIDKVFQRRTQGLCTLPMARALMKFGMSPDVSFEAARQQLDALARCQWRPSSEEYEIIRHLAA